MTPTSNNNSEDNKPNSLSIDPRLLELLVCPITRATLDFDRQTQELISRAGKIAFPIKDGIPIMLQSDARHLTD